MDLLYLPTVIGLVAKYGSYIQVVGNIINGASTIEKAFVNSIGPLVESEIAKVPGGSTLGQTVNQVLQSIGQPQLDDAGTKALEDRLSQMS